MDKMRTIFMLGLFTIIIISSSCKSILLRAVGMRMPKIETKKSIEQFIRQSDNNMSNIFSLDTTLYEKLRRQSFKPGWPIDFRPIQIRAYDKFGNPILHWASCEGYLSDLKTFDTVPPRNQVNLDSTLNLHEDLSRYFTLDGKPVEIDVQGGYDYYFVIYFAKFFPKMSKISFAAVDEYKKKHPELKIMVYKITVDVMDWWGAELVTDIKITHPK